MLALEILMSAHKKTRDKNRGFFRISKLILTGLVFSNYVVSCSSNWTIY